MKITEKHLSNLEACLRGEPVERAETSDNPNQRYHVGGVWYGNWRHDASKGSTFGSARKPRHNACISKHSKKLEWFTLAPITTEKPDNWLIVTLPTGTIPGGKLAESYLVAKYKLFASRSTLDDRFEHKCNLSNDIVQQMKEAMKV